MASTIELAHGLGLRMVAEGVETAAVYAELTRLGCDQVQGYLMCRPLPAAELERWLDRRAAGLLPTSGVPGQRTSASAGARGVRGPGVVAARIA